MNFTEVKTSEGRYISNHVRRSEARRAWYKNQTGSRFGRIELTPYAEDPTVCLILLATIRHRLSPLCMPPHISLRSDVRGYRDSVLRTLLASLPHHLLIRLIHPRHHHLALLDAIRILRKVWVVLQGQFVVSSLDLLVRGPLLQA